jgi:hypothetical protein
MTSMAVKLSLDQILLFRLLITSDQVPDSTLEYDQTTKLSLYAKDQIQDYWIVNLVATQLERYSQPYQDTQGNFGYRVKQISLRNEIVTLPGFSDLLIDLNCVFPGS